MRRLRDQRGDAGSRELAAIADREPSHLLAVSLEETGRIPGGIGPALEGGAGGVTFYVECPDIEQSLKTATKLGAKVVMPAKKMPGGPTLALFDDPEGHTIGLVQSE